jgi:hypothetical protein
MNYRLFILEINARDWANKTKNMKTTIVLVCILVLYIIPALGMMNHAVKNGITRAGIMAFVPLINLLGTALLFSRVEVRMVSAQSISIYHIIDINGRDRMELCRIHLWMYKAWMAITWPFRIIKKWVIRELSK